jgi:methylase of polypeptide subunit release factors
MSGTVDYDYKAYEDLSVSYSAELLGGGQRYGQDYLRLLSLQVGKVDRIFEWCAGAGFIGFSLLARGSCETLCLADVNEEAVDACRNTIERNGLQDRVDVYLSDGLQEIPTSESWDLVVGNPPHSGTDEQLAWAPELIYMDVDWKVHRDFYANVGQFLSQDSQVIIQENKDRSSVEDFEHMMEEGGLRAGKTTDCLISDHIYYMWSSLRPEVEG